MSRGITSIGGALALAAFSVFSQAGIVTIPQSALTPSTQLYTTDIGGGLGAPVVFTGGMLRATGPNRNDDGYSDALELGFTLNFFGQAFDRFYVNNNGNISFGGGIADYTPTGPQGALQRIISPFFADVDTRGAGSGLVFLRHNDNELIVTWNGVGYYNANDSLLNTFQLVLRGPGYAIPAGEGQIGFFYSTMQWETGNASGGTGGFGGTPAAVGFGDGNANGFVLQGSTQNGISQVLNNTRLWFTLSETGSPVVVPPTAVPEPTTLALLVLGLAAAHATRRRRTR